MPESAPTLERGPSFRATRDDRGWVILREASWESLRARSWAWPGFQAVANRSWRRCSPASVSAPVWSDARVIEWGPERYRTRFQAVWDPNALHVPLDAVDDVVAHDDQLGRPTRNELADVEGAESLHVRADFSLATYWLPRVWDSARSSASTQCLSHRGSQCAYHWSVRHLSRREALVGFRCPCLAGSGCPPRLNGRDRRASVDLGPRGRIRTASLLHTQQVLFH
jgi:hypothetical protein